MPIVTEYLKNSAAKLHSLAYHLLFEKKLTVRIKVSKTSFSKLTYNYIPRQHTEFHDNKADKIHYKIIKFIKFRRRPSIHIKKNSILLYVIQNNNKPKSKISCFN